MSRLKGRRGLTAVGVLAIAAMGAVWSGCGNDEQDQAQEALDSIQEQADQALEDAGVDTAAAQLAVEQAAEDAGDSAQEVQDAVDEATQDAQDAANQAADDAQQAVEGN